MWTRKRVGDMRVGVHVKQGTTGEDEKDKGVRKSVGQEGADRARTDHNTPHITWRKTHKRR
jgi:hypothetical protein